MSESGRPTHEWKAQAKCEKCLEANPDRCNKSEKDVKREQKVEKFKKDLKKGTANIADIIDLTH